MHAGMRCIMHMHVLHNAYREKNSKNFRCCCKRLILGRMVGKHAGICMAWEKIENWPKQVNWLEKGVLKRQLTLNMHGVGKNWKTGQNTQNCLETHKKASADAQHAWRGKNR